MYAFCRAFHCTPEEYKNTLDEDVEFLLEIHKQLKTLEQEEIERNNAKHR